MRIGAIPLDGGIESSRQQPQQRCVALGHPGPGLCHVRGDERVWVGALLGGANRSDWRRHGPAMAPAMAGNAAPQRRAYAEPVA